MVITTEAADEDRARALELGANAYLVKPVQAHTCSTPFGSPCSGSREGL